MLYNKRVASKHKTKKSTLAEHKTHIHIIIKLTLAQLLANVGPTQKHILHIRNLRWPNIVPMLAKHQPMLAQHWLAQHWIIICQS